MSNIFEYVASGPPRSNGRLLDALQIYIHQFGKVVSKDDLSIGLPTSGPDLDVNLAPRILARAGLVGRVLHSRKKLRLKEFPRCITLKKGGFAVVIAKEIDVYVLADIDIAGGIKFVPHDELAQNFDGTIIAALPQLEDIQRRHVKDVNQSHWFWGKFKKQKKIILDIVLGTFVANILALAVSLFALQVYDRVIPNRSMTTLWVLAVGCVTAIGFEAILRLSRSYLMDVSGKLLELEITSFLFERLTHMRLSTRPSSPGSLVYMMREFGSIREFFTATSVGSVADIPFVGIFLFLIYTIAGPVVWIIVIAMVLIILPSLLFQRKMSRLSSEMLGGTAAAGKLLTEVAYAHETVKTTRAESFFQHQWEEINTLNAAKTTQQRTLASGLTYWAMGVQQMAYIAVVVAGVLMVFRGEFTIGTIIAISILCSRTLAPITQLSGALARWQQIKSALAGLDDIANAPQERPSGRSFARKDFLQGDLELKNANFHYGDEEGADLQIEHLKIRPREIVAILGENGSGKSTLLKVISGLYNIKSGMVSIDGLELRQLDPEDVRRNIGYLPQDVKLFAGSLRDNLTMGRHHYAEELLFEAIEFAGLDKFVFHHPRGLDLMISDGGEGMSTGQRQSLGLARLYLQDPRIILLDEPTASLDQALEVRLVTRMRQWLSGRTCLIATHRIPILSLTSRIIVMKNGEIKLDGPRDQVLQKLTQKPILKKSA